MSDLGWTVEPGGAPNVHLMRAPFQRNGDWSFEILAIADQHWDNPKCDRRLLARHMDEAVAKGAPIVMVGDLFCLMQGKYDPRRSKKNVRPEHNVANYLDAVVDDCAEWHRPYAQNIALAGYGNHETKVLKNIETDTMQRWAAALGSKTGHTPAIGGYQGWLKLMLAAPGSSFSASSAIRYHHGHGGGGIVTKGTLWPLRRAAVVPDCDIHLSGHIHEQWTFPIVRERLSTNGVPYRDTQLHVSLSTYKEEYLEGHGYHVENGRPPKPLGGAWLRFYWSRSAERVRWQAIPTEDR